MSTQSSSSPLAGLAGRARAVTSGPRHARAVRVVAALVLLEAVAVGLHLAAGAIVTQPRLLVYPFVWVNIVAYALVRAPSTPLRRDRRLAAVGLAVGAAYVGLAAWFTGMVAVGTTPPATGLHVMAAPPGWGPMVAYDGALVRVTLVPFQAVGYVGLGLLVALAVARASRSLAAGALGLASCVGCTLSAVGALGTVVAGSSLSLSAAVGSATYDVSTLVFAATVLILLAGVTPAEARILTE